MDKITAALTSVVATSAIGVGGGLGYGISQKIHEHQQSDSIAFDITANPISMVSQGDKREMGFTLRDEHVSLNGKTYRLTRSMSCEVSQKDADKFSNTTGDRFQTVHCTHPIYSEQMSRIGSDLNGPIVYAEAKPKVSNDRILFNAKSRASTSGALKDERNLVASWMRANTSWPMKTNDGKRLAFDARGIE